MSADGVTDADARVTSDELGAARVAELDSGGQFATVARWPTSSKTATRAPWPACWASASWPPSGPTASWSAAWAARRSAPTSSAPASPALPVPYQVVRGYELPAWVSERTLVVAVSYSGNTEETLSCVERALPRGCRPVCVASGGRLAELAAQHGLPLVAVPAGLQPRASIGYLAMPVGAALEAAGLAPGFDEQVAEAIEVVAALGAELGPDVPTTTTRPSRSPAAWSIACRSSTARASRRRRRGAGRARSTRTPKRRPSSTSCPSSTTTRSPAGRPTPAWRSAPCSSCSTIPPATSACGAAWTSRRPSWRLAWPAWCAWPPRRAAAGAPHLERLRGRLRLALPGPALRRRPRAGHRHRRLEDAPGGPGRRGAVLTAPRRRPAGLEPVVERPQAPSDQVPPVALIVAAALAGSSLPAALFPTVAPVVVPRETLRVATPWRGALFDLFEGFAAAASAAPPAQRASLPLQRASLPLPQRAPLPLRRRAHRPARRPARSPCWCLCAGSPRRRRPSLCSSPTT